MNLEDAATWKLVTDTVRPCGLHSPAAAAIQPRALGVRRTFRTVLDLHGLTIDQAHGATSAFIQAGRLRRLKYIMVITGRSGAIRAEFPAWMGLAPGVRRIEPMNGEGAFKVYLTKL